MAGLNWSVPPQEPKRKGRKKVERLQNCFKDQDINPDALTDLEDLDEYACFKIEDEGLDDLVMNRDPEHLMNILESVFLNENDRAVAFEIAQDWRVVQNKILGALGLG